MTYRSHGGGEQTTNLIGLCGAHHLPCLHRGRMRVEGNADGTLTWKLGMRDGVPLETHVTP